MNKGVLVLLGSGETAPGMTKVHRELLNRLNDVRAVNLDTAYGFQENVPQMTEKLLEYFNVSLQTDFTPLHFTNFATSSEVDRALVKQQIREANYVFAGPGSPSYALHQWQPLGLKDDLQAVLANDGVVCFSSAAALTIGAFTAPIYEIYKVGVEPYWLEGLNVIEVAGLNCVVVPHFDNNEGANYDTSCCYMGKRRLELLEKTLPTGTATLGIDEHTALIIDLNDQTIRVLGRSNAYWRLNGDVLTLPNGSTTPLSELQSFTPVLNVREEVTASLPTSPADLATLALEGGPEGTEALAKLVQLASTGGEGYIEPTALIEGIIAARKNARAQSAYALADELRDALIAGGIDVKDSPEGSTWSIKSN